MSYDYNRARRERILRENRETKGLLADLKKQRNSLWLSMLIYGSIIGFYISIMLFLVGAFIYTVGGIDVTVIVLLAISIPLAYVILVKETRRVAKLFKSYHKDYVSVCKSIKRWSETL